MAYLEFVPTFIFCTFLYFYIKSNNKRLDRIEKHLNISDKKEDGFDNDDLYEVK